VRENTGLRVAQSYPVAIRKEMAVFRKALTDRYSGQIVMVKVDTQKLALYALRKADGEGKWTTCWERHPLPIQIMLPEYRLPESITLPEEEGGGVGG
jgi:hypothetical protein